MSSAPSSIRQGGGALGRGRYRPPTFEPRVSVPTSLGGRLRGLWGRLFFILYDLHSLDKHEQLTFKSLLIAAA